MRDIRRSLKLPAARMTSVHDTRIDYSGKERTAENIYFMKQEETDKQRRFIILESEVHNIFAGKYWIIKSTSTD